MKRSNAFTSKLGPMLSRYLAVKEALGRRYLVERSVLAHLDRFLGTRPQTDSELTAKTFRSWHATFAHLTPTVRRNRMRIVRNFCLYRQRIEPGAYVPDTTDFPAQHQSRRPFLFDERQIMLLLQAADALRPTSTSPLYGEGLRLAIVLLYTSGIRRGELVRLKLDDYDGDQHVLLIRDTKFHKSRLVPLSQSAAREMEAYLRVRRRLSHSGDGPLLCTRHGGIRHYSGAGLGDALRRLFQHVNIRTADGHIPRTHDLRHTFAVQALRRWYQDGVDVQSKLPALATYMGHVSIVSTEYYLALLDPFAEAVSERFARHCSPFLTLSKSDGGAS